MDEVPSRRPLPILPIFFLATTFSIIAGMALNWIQPPTISTAAGPEEMMVPLALVFSSGAGLLVAAGAYFARKSGWLSGLAAFGCAFLAGVFGMGCGYGCFSAVWAT